MPRLLYPKKPVHPFWGLGLLIYEDRHVFEKEAPAPTLVGYAYTDGGLLAVVVYLGLGGMLLGLMREKRQSRTLDLLASWVQILLPLWRV